MSRSYTVHNWSEYSTQLIQRGNLSIFIQASCFTSAYKPGKGRSQLYSDALIIFCHAIKYLYHLGYRQTQGLRLCCLHHQ